MIPNNNLLHHQVQWAMQGVSLIIVFLSSDYREASLGVIILVMTHHCIPARVKAKLRTMW